MMHRLLTLGPDHESQWVQLRVHPVGDQTKALKGCTTSL